MGERTLSPWTNDQDNVIIEQVRKARGSRKSKKAAFVACSEHELFADKTVKSVSMRFYDLNRRGLVPDDIFDRKEDSEIETDSESSMDLLGIFSEMKKIIKERDELKAKYEDAMAYKIHYEDMKKRLAKIEREAAVFHELMRGRK